MMLNLSVQQGFTLIELMIVIAIIAIIAAISIPSYLKYVDEANLKSCLSETKAYSNSVFYSMSSSDELTTPQPISQACLSISDASTWAESAPLQITGIPKNSDSKIICDFGNAMKCTIVE